MSQEGSPHGYPYTVICEINLYNFKRLKNSWKYQVNRKYNWHLQSETPVRKNSETLKFWSCSDTASATGSWHLKVCVEKAGWHLCPAPTCSRTDVSGAAVICPPGTRHHHQARRETRTRPAGGGTNSPLSQKQLLNVILLCDRHEPEGTDIPSPSGTGALPSGFTQKYS